MDGWEGVGTYKMLDTALRLKVMLITCTSSYLVGCGGNARCDQLRSTAQRHTGQHRALDVQGGLRLRGPWLGCHWRVVVVVNVHLHARVFDVECMVGGKGIAARLRCSFRFELELPGDWWGGRIGGGFMLKLQRFEVMA